MVRIPRPDEPAVGINLSPLIDVVFILLIFVILVAKFIDLERMDVDVPDSAAGEQQTQLALLVLVRADGQIVVQDREVELKDLQAVLRRLHKEHNRVVIVADENARVAAAVAVLTAARLERYEQVAIATEEPDG